MPKFCGAAAAAIAFCLWPRPALAHREDYLDETVVFLTLGREELETEYWLDYGTFSDTDTHFFRHNVATEYGITDHWMIDGRLTSLDEEGEDPDLDSGRLETRYRFFDEGTLPIDVAVSGELNAERNEAGDVEWGLEPRLILSRDFREKWNVTANLPVEVTLDSHKTTEFIPALGVRFNATDVFRYGCETRYNIQTNEGAVIPQAWLALPNDVTIKIGYAKGLDREREDFLRIALEVEF